MHPFEPNTEGAVGQWGEVELIRRIAEWLGPVNPPPPEGMGDDCAVYFADADRPQLLTTDPVLYGYHFDDTVSPENAGAKLLKRNISDVAAMGGRPLRAVLSLTLPAKTSTNWVRDFIHGLRTSAQAYRVLVVGGDVAQSERFLGAFLTLVGDAPAGRALTRTGARTGDHIFVTGELGGSGSGHHFAFEPRVNEGLWLAGRNEVRSMIDVSDGLAKDLPALLPSGTDAELDWERLPVRRAARRLAEKDGVHPWVHALCDGEDYELAFTVDGAADPRAFMRAYRDALGGSVSAIGRIVPRTARAATAPRIRIPPGSPVAGKLQAYEHFRTDRKTP